jgi:hypothetical protein
MMKHFLTIIVFLNVAVLLSGKVRGADHPEDRADTTRNSNTPPDDGPGKEAMYHRQAVTYYIAGDYDEALRYGLLAVSTGERLGDSTLLMSDIYNQVALLFILTQDFEKTLIYGRKGWDVAARHRSVSAVYACTSNIAAALSKLQRYDEGFSELKRTEKLFPTRDPAILLISNLRYLNICVPPAGADHFKQWYLGISR